MRGSHGQRHFGDDYPFPEDHPNPYDEEECPELLKELDDFGNDPITQFYGVEGEMAPLIIKNHKKRHGCGVSR